MRSRTRLGQRPCGCQCLQVSRMPVTPDAQDRTGQGALLALIPCSKGLLPSWGLRARYGIKKLYVLPHSNSKQSLKVCH
jgi:hypothetical protein